MSTNNLAQTVLDGSAPRNLRMLIARGLAPIPLRQTLELLIALLADSDSEISSRASETLASWNREELATELQSPDCSQAVLKYFARADSSDRILEAIAANPAASGEMIASVASAVPAALLVTILDNRVRIIEHPAILDSIKRNPSATPEIRRLVQEIESEFFAGKKTEYEVDALATAVSPEAAPDEGSPAGELAALESDVLLEDFSLEGLPLDGEERQAELSKRISCLSVRQKIQQALFGNREIRAVLVRDTNKEVARSVLRSPKLTENEVESIAAMRGVAEDILRDLGTSREWTRNYTVVLNLVKNPKTPPAISQRLLFRLQTRDLMLLTRDRSVPDAVRHNATRAYNQRTATRTNK